MRALVFLLAAWTSISSSAPSYQTQEVKIGKTAIIKCHSNDADHNFMFWANPRLQLIIGPGNDFDNLKYDYEILTGTLIIKAVTAEDEGDYECVSRGIRNDNINIETVKLLIIQTQQASPKQESGVHFFVVVITVGAVIIIAASAFLIYKNLRKKEFNQLNYSDPSDEDSGEDVYSKAGPSTSGEFQPKKEKVKSAFDNPAMSGDLKNILINTDE